MNRRGFFKLLGAIVGGAPMLRGKLEPPPMVLIPPPQGCHGLSEGGEWKPAPKARLVKFDDLDDALKKAYLPGIKRDLYDMPPFLELLD